MPNNQNHEVKSLKQHTGSSRELAQQHTPKRVQPFYTILALIGLLHLELPTQASTLYTPLHSFTGSVDGQNPAAGLIQGSDGAFYGTTDKGGAGGGGTVFRIDLASAQLTPIHSFDTNTLDGNSSFSSVLQASDGLLYGVTFSGGTNAGGTVFRMSLSGSNYQVLRAFGAGPEDGKAPYSTPLEGQDRHLYGTTFQGGQFGGGTIYRMQKDGSDYRVLLHLNPKSQGESVFAGLTQLKSGRIYGAALTGGQFDKGTLFSMNPDGSSFVVLHHFGTNLNDGSLPYGTLLEASDGRLYGTTATGGPNGAGTIFRLNSDGTAYQILHQFEGSGGKPGRPQAGVIEGADGFLYGTTLRGGPADSGTLFRIGKEGAGFEVVHGTGLVPGDGLFNNGSLVRSGIGAFLGTSAAGGATGNGVIYRVQVSDAQPGLRLMGDFDGNRSASLPDLVHLINHIKASRIRGATVEDGLLEPSSIPYADLTLDGVINESDADTLADIILAGGTLPSIPLATVHETSPSAGEGNVGVRRETVFRLSRALGKGQDISTNHLYAVFGGRRFLARAETASDRKTVTLFYQEPLPPNARVRVTFDGTTLTDELGLPVDLDGDGAPGGVRKLDFDTVNTGSVAGTVVEGHVYASELISITNLLTLPDGSTAKQVVQTNKPLEHVLISVDGREQDILALTDSKGYFKLTNAPSGRFFVHINGKTAVDSSFPTGGYYPEVGKAWEAAAGQTNSAGGTGLIYLPWVLPGSLTPVSVTNETIVSFPSEITATNPVLAGVSITIPPNALFTGGQNVRGGSVAIAPVASDRLPGPLPPGLEFPLVITVQTSGGENFDQPVPVRFPNLPDPTTGIKLAPGERTALWTYNHDKGEWEVAGNMTVTADGLFVESDPGQGLRQPGWIGPRDRPVSPPNCVRVPCCGPSGAGGTSSPPPPISGRIAGIQLQSLSGDTRECPPCVDRESLATHNERCEREYDRDEIRINRLFDDMLEACKEADATGITYLPCTHECINKRADLIVEAEKKRDRCRDSCKPCPDVFPFLSRAGAVGPPARLNEVDHALQAILDFLESLDPIAPYPDSVLVEFERLLAGLDQAAGGDAQKHFKTIEADLESKLASLNQRVLPLVGNAPDYPVDYAATVRFENSQIVIRGKTAGFGQYDLFVPLGATIEWVGFFDRRTKMQGAVFPGPLTVSRTLPRFFLSDDSTKLDQDGDGLSDFAENILGTNEQVSDTDADGILDGVELDQGTNPLDGRPVITGIIASADTQGVAVDICAINNTVVVADSEAGVTVFNVENGQNPIRVAQVDTPGNAIAASCSGNLIAVADSEAGLAIVDVTDPPAAKIVNQLSSPRLGGGSVKTVATVADLAFVGTTLGIVSMVELTTGVVLQQVALPASPLHDLVIEGVTLYAYSGNKVFVLPFGDGPLQLAGSVDSPAPIGINTENGRGRLFVGNSIGYAVHSKGYNTLDLKNPGNPSLIAAANNNQFGWKNMALNGSGLGLAAASASQHFSVADDVWLYDTTNPKSVTNFITSIATPGVARAVSIYNGLAYVADHSSGMQVINYLPYDSKKLPPTGSLILSSTNTTPVGSLVLLRAEVQDDVQVRSVEFFVNGQPLLKDGNFPFEAAYRVPVGLLGSDLTFTSILKDTGGNTTTNGAAAVRVIPDNRAPTVAVRSPAEGEEVRSIDELVINVNAFDFGGLESLTLLLDGNPISPTRLSYEVWLLKQPLSYGNHTLRVVARDYAGLTTTVNRRFTVARDVVSREVSVFTFSDLEVRDAVSREVSVFTSSEEETKDAISREVSVQIKNQ